MLLDAAALGVTSKPTGNQQACNRKDKAENHETTGSLSNVGGVLGRSPRLFEEIQAKVSQHCEGLTG
jgi:hypothetical protein